MSKRIHDDLLSGMARAVVHHKSLVAPDPPKALGGFCNCRDMLERFVVQFDNESNHALAYMDSPDRELVGELFYVLYVATAVANRLDQVIARLEKR
jgi:hypothetical protein